VRAAAAAAAARACDRLIIIILLSSSSLFRRGRVGRGRALVRTRAPCGKRLVHARARGPCDYHGGGDGRDSVIESMCAAAARTHVERRIKLPILYAARGGRRSLVTRALNDIGRVL